MSVARGIGSAATVIVRSVLPSPISLLATFLVALLIIVGHVLLLSLSGRAFPTHLDDVLLNGYANYVVGPLEKLASSNALNLLLLAVLWGAAGLTLYEIVVHIITGLQALHSENEAINMPSEGVVRRHPLEKSLLIHVAWRLLIVMLSLLLTAVVVPAVRFCLSNQEKLLGSSSLGYIARVAGVCAAVWMLIMHCYLVLLRWYMFRTRVTGEILD